METGATGSEDKVEKTLLMTNKEIRKRRDWEGSIRLS